MKKIILAMGLSSLGLMNAYAQDSTDISVSGYISDTAGACAVQIDKSSIQLYADPAHINKQAEQKLNYYSPDGAVNITIDGDEGCHNTLKSGRIYLKFTGPADNADGTVLANTADGENAAKGVGVGIFSGSYNNIMFHVNQSIMPVYDKPTSVNLGVVQLSNQSVVPGDVQTSMTVNIERL